MGPICVVPLDDQLQFFAEGFAPQRDQNNQPQRFLERADEPLDDGDAAVLCRPIAPQRT